MKEESVSHLLRQYNGLTAAGPGRILSSNIRL